MQTKCGHPKLESQFRLHGSGCDGDCIESFPQPADSCSRRGDNFGKPRAERYAKVHRDLRAILTVPDKKLGERGSYV